jgi:hypothetical protein
MHSTFIIHRSSLSMNDRPLVNRAIGGTTNGDGRYFDCNRKAGGDFHGR